MQCITYWIYIKYVSVVKYRVSHSRAHSTVACVPRCLAAPLLFCFLYKVQKLLYFFSHSHFDKNRMIINLHFAQPPRATPTPRRDRKKKGWANGCGRRFGCLALQGGVSPACHQPPLLYPLLLPFHPLSFPPSLRTELDAPGRARVNVNCCRCCCCRCCQCCLWHNARNVRCLSISASISCLMFCALYKSLKYFS